MENLWGNCRKWINGLTCYQSKIFYKLCNYTADGSTATGYDPVYYNPGYKTYSRSASGSVTLYNLGMPNTSDGIMRYWPSSGAPTAGSNSTYYCDYAYCLLNSSSSDVGCAQFGGRYNDGAFAGLFYVDLYYNHPLSISVSSYGASLSCKPL